MNTLPPALALATLTTRQGTLGRPTTDRTTAIAIHRRRARFFGLVTVVSTLLLVPRTVSAGDLVPNIRLTAGYGGSSGTSCLTSYPGWCSPHVTGALGRLSLGLAYGDFVRLGAFVSGSFVPRGDDRHSGVAIISATLRFGRQWFAELGLGAAYTWAHENVREPPGRDPTLDDFGGAISLLGGVFVTETLAIIAAAEVVPVVPGFLSLTAGLEWAP